MEFQTHQDGFFSSTPSEACIFAGIQLPAWVKLELRPVPSNLVRAIRRCLSHTTHNRPVLVVNLGGERDIPIHTAYKKDPGLVLRALGG